MSFRYLSPHDVISGKAGADLRQSQYRALVRDANGEFVRSGAGGDVYGILENNPNTGQHANVAISGIIPALSGGAFARDAKLVSDAAGRLVAATGAAGAEVRAYYRAEQAATAADQFVAVRREVADVRF